MIRKIEEIPAEQWGKVFPDVPENYYFLKTLDESKFNQFSFYYVLVYRGQQLVGCAPCFRVDYSLDTSISGPLRRLTNAITKKFPRLLSIRALVCGIPMGQGQMGIAGFSSAVFEAIEKRMESLARKLHAPLIAFKDFDRSYDKFFHPLLQDDFMKIDSLPMTCLKLDFSSFEDYLKTLSSATRYDVRRKLKKASGAAIEPMITDTLDENTLNEVYDLYLAAVETHDMGFEIVPKEFFRLISKNMPQETKFFLWRINGKLTAFVFCLVSNGKLLDYYLGLDHTLSHEFHLYFVKFKEVFEWCKKHGVQSYEMGATGYEPKRRLKFEFIPVYLYVKSRYKIFSPFLKILSSLLKFENFDPELRRWKKSRKSTN
ncbi:MAG: GNAT family N-acetyltransferase [Candidatus Omnitrophica bacterium]|nr:GNAT family N-acetyltransferase [Candidatus Omnitrophota bacterium]MDE2008791.1 GNAT family N-acetyltransferase [Candidatus Omnitrophota bacterium]MDE2230453.1 GNAT family N-acetyltransferase [Candidatus Omnitrophota bacterium]